MVREYEEEEEEDDEEGERERDLTISEILLCTTLSTND